MHRKAIHPLSHSLYHPATRWPYVTVMKMQGVRRPVCGGVRLDLLAWTLAPARPEQSIASSMAGRRGAVRHAEVVIANRSRRGDEKTHFGAESVRKMVRQRRKSEKSPR